MFYIASYKKIKNVPDFNFLNIFLVINPHSPLLIISLSAGGASNGANYRSLFQSKIAKLFDWQFDL